MATMIGSLPHTDPEAAVRLVLDHFPEVPVVPELPRRSFLEDMVHAHSGGLPCLVVDQAAEKMWVETARDCSAELAAFYERALTAEQSGDLDAFAVGPGYASALEAARHEFLARSEPYPVVKVQCIGPVSFQLGLRDDQDRALYYDETFQDVLGRQVALQARWLVRRFRPCGHELIVFLDEPCLAAFGSSGYLGVLREDVVLRLGTAIEAVKSEGATVGVHVCGNSDWPMIIEAGAEILNYDAYGFGPSMLVYADQIGEHMARGGILAWGIVPNNHMLHEESAASIEKRFFSLVDRLCERGVDRDLVLRQSMLTPACGLASLTPEDAELAMRLLADLAVSVQAKVR
ncbi:MAG TPA: hypothetical protein VM425_06990 [Myxococcota bacterium]|nr:hypothetical protein [Myxococcota bacterium]